MNITLVSSSDIKKCQLAGYAVTDMLPVKAGEERSNEDKMRLRFPPECV